MPLTKIGILRDFVTTGIDDNANATALTLDANENATFANGVTASSFSGDGSNLTGLPGGGISYVTKTANYTATVDQGVIADTSGGSFTVTLPASPSAGDQVYVADPDNWATNNLTIGRNGSTIEGAAEDFTVDIGGIIVGFVYDGSTWQVYPQSGFAAYQTLDSVLTVGATSTQAMTVGNLTSTGIDDNATSTALTINSDGEVGIGITSPSTRLDVREEKTGGALLVQVYNTDNSDTTTQTAGLALGPDSRGATAKITAVKENADFSTNAGRDVALAFSSVLNNSPTERMRIDSAGQIIILGNGGSTVNSLDLSYNGSSGQATIQADSSGGDTYLTFGTSASGSVAERMRITSAGSVGIGITNPSQELHVKGSVTVANFEGTGGSGFIQITDSDDGTTGFVGVDAGKLKFQTSGSSYSDKVVIDTAGKVGIGTSAPQSLLQLNTTPPTAFGSPFLSVGFNTYTGSGMYTIAFGYEALSGSIAPGEIGLVTTSDSSYTKGDLVFATRDVVTNTAPTERMRIAGNGFVGIGETSPDRHLHLKDGGQIKLESTGTGSWIGIDLAAGNGTYDGYFGMLDSDGRFFIDIDSNGEDFTIKQNGFVGIGDTNPPYRLSVANSGEIAFYGEGSSTGHTQGALVSASGTDSTPSARGQGVFMFNHGTDTTWYMGGVYGTGGPDQWNVCRKGSTTALDTGAAQSSFSLMNLTSAGNLSIDGTLTQNSDASIKDNVENLSNQLDNVNALRPVEYDRNDKEKAGEHEIGLIAQEVEALLPILVGERNGLKTLDYTRLSVIAIKALQELSTQVNDLKAEIAALKGV